ncbi:unnamed protein product [Urochloa decumbens]|uniref:Ubiquitin-like protease family profile domain-containing protein n=1 Tax=Urochloa decumbens TaxID=240449 RepID=A0ABC8VA79_9POAL
MKEDPIVERVTRYVSHDLGLQAQIDITLNAVQLNGYKWPDLHVSSWPVIEQIQEPMQTDGVSCGLFLITFMEYWTGDRLSDPFSQEDMQNFRLKVAAILLGSSLNAPNLKHVLDDHASSEEQVADDPNDCVMITPTQPSQLTCRRFKDTAQAICDYIMSITDEVALGKEWVRSSSPYPISINLKQLQEILDVNMCMDKDCFNLGVRMLACDETAVMREPKCHFLDLKFSLTTHYRRHRNFRVKLDPKQLAELFDDWPNSGVSFSECELVLVPFQSLGAYGLFALDRKHRTIAIIDPRPVYTNASYNNPYYYYVDRIQKVAAAYDRAMEVVEPEWRDDVYDWHHTFPALVPKTFDRKWFLIEVLKCKMNECAENIPEEIRAAVHSIRNTYVEKFL